MILINQIFLVSLVRILIYKKFSCKIYQASLIYTAQVGKLFQGVCLCKVYGRSYIYYVLRTSLVYIEWKEVINTNRLKKIIREW